MSRFNSCHIAELYEDVNELLSNGGRYLPFTKHIHCIAAGPRFENGARYENEAKAFGSKGI
jgi:hypothetical protein